MKKKFEIAKSRLYSKADYTEMLEKKQFGGISLSYGELDGLPINTGAICVFDAYGGGAVKPFLQIFDYKSCVPFYVSAPTSRGNKIAFAGLRFSSEKAAEWKLALFNEKDVIKLASNGGSVASRIDSGIVCIGDFENFSEYEALVREHGKRDSHPLDGVLSFDGNAAFKFPVTDNSAVAVFSSGWGDGCFSSYIGYGESGNPVSFICDFDLLEYDVKDVSGDVIEYEFDTDIEELYVDDPALSVDENNVKKWTLVLDYKGELDDFALYKAYSGRGFALHRLGRLDDALKDYYSALAITEDKNRKKNFKMREWTLYDNAGTINRALGNKSEAIRLFEKAKNLDDSFYSGAYSNLIDIYSGEKNYDKALEICDEMTKRRPLDPVSFMSRAEINVSLGNFAAAIKDYDVLIEKFLWDDGIFEKVSCLIELERYDEAEKSLAGYLTENAANELYYYSLGLLEYKRGKYVKSYENLLRAFECNPEYVSALNLLIEIDDLFLDFVSELSWARLYIDCRPSGGYGYYVRAEQNLRLGNYREAARDREFIAENFGGDALNGRGIVCAYILAKDFSRAKKAIKNLKKKDSAAYMNSLGLYYIAKRKFPKGEKLLLSAAADGESETYFADLIDAYIYSGNIKAAENYIEKAARFAPSSARLLFSRISLCKKTNDMNGLSDVLNEYLRKYLPTLDDAEYIDRVKTRLINYPFVESVSK